MLSKSVKAKRRRNKTYYELVRKIEVRCIDRTTSGNHYLISLTSPTRKNFAHHFDVSGEKKLSATYAAMLQIARQEAYRVSTGITGKRDAAYWQRNSHVGAFAERLRADQTALFTANSNSAHKTSVGKPNPFGPLSSVSDKPGYKNVPIRAFGETEVRDPNVSLLDGYSGIPTEEQAQILRDIRSRGKLTN